MNISINMFFAPILILVNIFRTFTDFTTFQQIIIESSSEFLNFYEFCIIEVEGRQIISEETCFFEGLAGTGGFQQCTAASRYLARPEVNEEREQAQVRHDVVGLEAHAARLGEDPRDDAAQVAVLVDPVGHRDCVLISALFATHVRHRLKRDTFRA